MLVGIPFVGRTVGCYNLFPVIILMVMQACVNS
jgi:hypothetical protein